MKDSSTNSLTYVSNWLKHFNNNVPGHTFNFIENLSFIKANSIPIYINVGKNLSLGISYSKPTNNDVKSITGYKNKVFLVYHVPTYFNIDEINIPRLGLKKIYDSTGYLINFKSFENLEDYLSKTLSASRVKKVKRNQRLLETRFDIFYRWFFGDNFTQDEYDFIFNSFGELLKKRYEGKNQYNRHLNDNIWEFYRDLFFPLIKEKKASFYVIYDGEKPLAICFNYHTPTSIKGAISVFDITYAKYEIGSLYLTKQFEWCFENNIEIFDLGLGNYGYKNRWANESYDIHHHIFYDKKSLIANPIAMAMGKYFELKLKLKKKGLKNIFVKNQNVQIN